MASSGVDLLPAFAKTVRFGEATLIVDLVDGRTLMVPVAWYPRLAHATPTERDSWQLIGRGEGVH